MIETIIYNVKVVTPQGVSHSYVTIDEHGFIAEVSKGIPTSEQLGRSINKVDGCGRLLMSGVIDCHVHFREPGLIHKATIESESSAAVAGGVTSYLDMPNTVPQTTSMAAIEEKLDIASRKSVANYGFFIGATNDNLEELVSADYSKVAGIKLFMGSSTGGMLVNNSEALNKLFEYAPAIISIHAESEAHIAAAREAIVNEYGDNPPVSLHTRLRTAEACLAASREAVALAKKYDKKINIAHLTTASELDLLDGRGDVEDKLITAEVSPHHLLWTEDDYESKGARIKMNPSVKSKSDRDRLRQAVEEGLIDIVATDHAPHLLAEKQGGLFKAVSGAPLVQFSLPLMLDMFRPEVVARVMAANPAKRFDIRKRGAIAPGYYADLALVEHVEEGYVVTDGDVLSLCGWTPLESVTLHHKVISTWVNGNLVYNNGVIYDKTPGHALEYQR